MQIKHFIVIALLGWVAGMACCTIFTCRSNKAGNNTLAVQEAAEKKYKQQAEAFAAGIKSLRQSAAIKEKELADVKRNSAALQLELQKRLHLQQDNKERKDTVAIITGCDTMQQQIRDYITVTGKEDSVQESVILNLKMQVNNHDSLLTISSAVNHLYQAETIQYKKANRKLKAGRRIRDIGLVILSSLLISRSFHR